MTLYGDTTDTLNAAPVATAVQIGGAHREAPLEDDAASLLYGDLPSQMDSMSVKSGRTGATDTTFSPDNDPLYDITYDEPELSNSGTSGATTADLGSLSYGEVYGGPPSFIPPTVYEDGDTDNYGNADDVYDDLDESRIATAVDNGYSPRPAVPQRTVEDAVHAEEALYGTGRTVGAFATASQLPQRVQGKHHPLAFKVYGEIVFSDMSRSTAETKLKALGKQPGAFLLRTSANLIDGVVLCVLSPDMETVRHYSFGKDATGNFVNKAQTQLGKTVVELIHFYKLGTNWKDGLPCPLSIHVMPPRMRR